MTQLRKCATSLRKSNIKSISMITGTFGVRAATMTIFDMRHSTLRISFMMKPPL
jgi:hypothetical protein